MNRRILLACVLPAAVAVARAAAPAAPAASSASDEAIKLNPFEIQADPDNSYGALNANSVTAFNTALDHLPVTADIFDQAFMKDVGAINVEAAISSYDAGSQFGALNASNPAQNQPGDHLANGSLRLRGSPIGGMQINGLLIAGSVGNPGGTSFGSTSNFYLDRIEVMSGPQALLFAGGGPGGVINIVSKQAHFGQPAFGELDYRVDQYGSKYATFDYGVSAGPLAVRVALVDGTNDSRRVNIGEHIIGGYVQLAGQIGNTVIRASAAQSVSNRVAQDYHTISSSAGDPAFQFNSDHLEYLLAVGQGPNIDHGLINWGNVQSLDGEWTSDHTVSEWASIQAESKWTSWLSTELSVAAGNFDDDQPGGGATINLYSPGSTSNPLPGQWSIGMPQSGFPLSDQWRPHNNTAIRGSVVLSNDLFGGKAHSQTNFTGDYTGNYNAIITYSWYQSDAAGNPTLATSGARVVIPTQGFSLEQGPSMYNFFNPEQNKVYYNGQWYVRQKQTQSGGLNGDFSAGYAVLNYTQWLDNKLDTLVGFRLSHQKAYTGAQPPSEEHNAPNFSVGADYHVLPWLAPYFLVSDVWATAAAQNFQPDGTLPQICHSTGAEEGFKINTDNGKISGSISVYQNIAKNEQFNGGGNLASFVSPNGINGQLPQGTGANFTSDVSTYGYTAAMTGTPTDHWRMRLSASITGGHFGKGVTFNELYNDQFYATSAGQVTYADGTPVYVPATFNSKQLTVPQGTANAVPLTITLLSTPGSQYYASPQVVNGAILKTSPGGLVLLSTDPTHGTIRTGVTGLPISAYQLNPALSGVAPIGQLSAVQDGNQTWGYPKYAMNFTNVYEFASGPIKGFKIGGTASLNWKNLVMYYYPNGFTGSNFSDQRPFYNPIQPQFDLIAGFTHKFKRITFSSQLNVYNLFNHYKVVIYPNVTTGWTSIPNLTANLDQQPRDYVWTNSIRF